MRFENQTALVTGAASGIGLAIASAFHVEGAFVVLADRRIEAVESARAGLPDPSKAAAVRLDVTVAEDVDRVMTDSWRERGGIDFLINCAGIYPSDPVLQMEEARWDSVIDTNLKGPFLCSQAFASMCVESGHDGSIVNITSGAARRARPGAVHYCTSKAGLEMLTQGLAIELSSYGIRVNAVSPGFVRVDSEVNPLSKEYEEAISKDIPLGRSGRPEDIAHAALFLCSHEAEWITGSILPVDGGSGAGSSSLPLSGP